MNQINLDALSRATSPSQGGSLAPLKLQPDVQYQAMLSQNQQGQAQLQLQTPQGIAVISLDKNQAALVQTALSPSNTAPSSAFNTATGQIKLSLSATITVLVQPATAASHPGVNESHANQDPQQQPLLVQLSPQSNGQMLLMPQAKASVQQFIISNTEVLQLLKPLSAEQASSSSLNTLAANKGTFVQLPVTLMRQEGQFILTLSNKRQLQLPLAWLPSATTLPMQQAVSAQLVLQSLQGQMQASLLLGAMATSERSSFGLNSLGLNSLGLNSLGLKSLGASTADTPLPTSSAKPATLSSATTTAPLLFTPAQSRQLLPTLVSAAQSGLAATDTASEGVGSKSAQASAVQWQLKAPDKSSPHWTLQLKQASTVADEALDPVKTSAIKIDSSQVNRPLQWQPTAITAETSKITARIGTIDITPLWRQLLPLSQSSVDPLRLDAELPPAVQGILNEIRQHSVDSAKALSHPQQLQQQLTAALQFNPQPQINPVAPPAAAATVALAIQLLLGRLAPQSTVEQKSTPSTKLQQLIGQLEPQQSSQLLRQLSGHASTMQSAQLATMEQQQPGQTQQLFIQLPLLQQGDSRFAEIAISEREADGSGAGQKRTQWQLTMKFDLASHGKLLVQVRLTGSQVSLQFYTEQQAPLTLAQQFLPLLKDRLKMQGLEVTEAQCQLGKIPPQLYQRHHSLVAVKV
jgi:hypothetical protein